MISFFCNRIRAPIPIGLRFPLEKNDILNTRPSKQNLINPYILRVSQPAINEQILLVQRARYSVGEKIQACQSALADPNYGDRLRQLNLTKKGLAKRDLIVLDSFRSKGLPVTIILVGAFAKWIKDTVDIHYETIYNPAKLHYKIV